jgi:hypothetical protein
VLARRKEEQAEPAHTFFAGGSQKMMNYTITVKCDTGTTVCIAAKTVKAALILASNRIQENDVTEHDKTLMGEKRKLVINPPIKTRPPSKKTWENKVSIQECINIFQGTKK